MCHQREPNNWSLHLYNKFGDVITEYLKKHCLPALKQVEHAYSTVFLKEWVGRWRKFSLVRRFVEQVRVCLRESGP